MKKIIAGFVLVLLLVAGSAFCFPYYFVAIHCDPPVIESIGTNYKLLRRMVDKANRSGVKLTIMFTAPWAKYIAESSQRFTEVRIWQSQGHELAAHHHGLNHGIWDGYTDYDPSYAELVRIEKGITPEPYQGTMKDLMRDLHPLGIIKSGCMNDEDDKAELPNEILYDTCGGFANFGAIGRPVSDFNEPMKGRNDFLTIGWWNGILHRWIAHYRVTNISEQVKARNVFHKTPDSSVYGVNFHAMQSQLIPFNMYLDFLVIQDPYQQKSLTVREIVEYQIIPEQLAQIDQF